MSIGRGTAGIKITSLYREGRGNMAGITGTLCSNETDLKRAASERRKKYREVSVRHDQAASYKEDGWEIVRENRATTRMRKIKDSDVLFEDRVWMLFYNLSFSCMNKDRNCKLEFNSFRKQIDVLARDEDNIFIVECKSSRSHPRVVAREPLEYWCGKREETYKALAAEWGQKFGRINVVVAISSEDKRDVDEEYALGIRDKNVFLWSAREIQYIENLIRQVGSAAKYQLYSVIFVDKKQSALRKSRPAIRGKIGGHVFYTFLISAKELIKYAYVHHRDLSGIVEASQVYQRMLRNTKLKEIAKFIDFEGGYFPNSIIVNFSKPLQWSKKEAFDNDIAMGTLKLPRHFGSAWIIDGQHRLYGAARANKDVLVPVLAFEDMEQLDQANLFVEINEKQTAVPGNLLWDLYSDIYRDSSDDKQKLLYQIAETAKEMEQYGPLKGCIEIPSIPADRPVKLTLTTVCSTIEKYSPWEHLKHPTDDTKTPENAARIINSYYRVLIALWSDDWEKGNKGVLLSNNGFGVFTMVFYDIVKHIVYKQKQALMQPTKTTQFEELLKNSYLTPVIGYLKTDEGMQRNIRSQTGRGPQSYNAGLLELKIQEFMPDFCPPRLGELPTISEDERPVAIPVIEQKAISAEPTLRNFVLEQLKLNYGSDKWWRQGLPVGTKKKADDEWTKQVERLPYLRHEENQNERKFEFLGLGDMIEVVVYRSNWEGIFEKHFVNKPNFQRRIRDIMVMRNPASHTRRMEDQDVIDGIGGLLWLSNCLGNTELNPYA